MNEVITDFIRMAINAVIWGTIKSTVSSCKLVKNIFAIKVEYLLSKRDFLEY